MQVVATVKDVSSDFATCARNGSQLVRTQVRAICNDILCMVPAAIAPVGIDCLSGVATDIASGSA